MIMMAQEPVWPVSKEASVVVGAETITQMIRSSLVDISQDSIGASWDTDSDKELKRLVRTHAALGCMD